MKSRLTVVVCALALVAAACSAGNPIASVDGVRITDEQVTGFYTATDVTDQVFDCTTEFLVATEVFVEAARTDLGITVTGGDIDDYIANPPAHRRDALGAIESEGNLSDDGLRAQVRRWALLDRIVDERVAGNDDLLAAMALATGTPVNDVIARPSAFMSVANNSRVVTDWIAELSAADGLAAVEVDPIFSTWDEAGDLDPADVCASGVIARVGSVGITEDDVFALNLPTQPASAELLINELIAMIRTELFAQEAEEEFGIVVTNADIAAFLDAPPTRWVNELVQLQGDGRFDEPMFRMFARQWLTVDAVVSRLIVDAPGLIDTLAGVSGATPEQIRADPLEYVPREQVGELFGAWTIDKGISGEFPEVVVDPEIGTWDPATGRLIPSGG